jgi:magnesium-transporting ATPase (P-type)
MPRNTASGRPAVSQVSRGDVGRDFAPRRSDLGSMDTVCTDKTGTITEGIGHLDGAYDGDG